MANYKAAYDAGSMSIILDSEQVEKALGDLKAKTPAALKVAINRTARQARRMMLDDVKERYDLNAAGRRMIQDLKQRKSATNKSLEARLGITRNEPGAFRADLGYFRTSPNRPYMGAAVRNAPEYFQARVLKDSPMKNLSGDGRMSKGFLVKFKSGHIGMVQRNTGKMGPAYTASGKVRWSPNHLLETMSSPSGSAMHRTIWNEDWPDVAEMLQDNAERRVAELILRYRK
ncbi:MAG: hypothetical protein ACLROS_03630 [Faecalibacterium sp.]